MIVGGTPAHCGRAAEAVSAQSAPVGKAHADAVREPLRDDEVVKILAFELEKEQALLARQQADAPIDRAAVARTASNIAGLKREMARVTGRVSGH